MPNPENYVTKKKGTGVKGEITLHTPTKRVKSSANETHEGKGLRKKGGGAQGGWGKNRGGG